MICKLLLKILVLIYIQKTATQTDWFENLINHIQFESKKYQAFLIANNDIQDLKTKVILEIPKSFPTQRVNFDCISQLDCFSKHRFFPDVRGTNLFIIVPSTNASVTVDQATKAVDSLIRLSGGRTRPKCLVILLNESKNSRKIEYKKLLRKMWSQQLLDATVVEINETPSLENYTEKRVYFTPRINQHITRLIHYNPFLKTKNFQKWKISPNTVWFPDKLQNLHQWQLKVSLISMFPMAEVKRNASGHLVKMSGLDANVIRFMARELNFSLLMIPHKYPSFGTFRKNGNQSDGLTRMLENNTLNLMANSLFGTQPAYRSWVELSRAMDRVSIHAMVPIQRDKIPSLIGTGKMAHTIGMCASLIFSLVILARILQLDRDVWQPLFLFQMLFGFGVKMEPRRQIDRIIFASMLITSMVLSMNIFEVCTDIGMNYEIEREIKSLDDLVESGLKTKISGSLRRDLLNNSFGSVLYTVLKNAQGMRLNRQVECLEELANYRNVCCLVKTPTVEQALEKYRDQSGKPIMRVVPEVVRDSWFFLYFERGSPYAPGFDRVFQRMHQSGIRSRFREKPKRWFARNTDHLENDDVKKICEMLRLFFLVVVVADCLAIVVFSLERFAVRRK